MRQVRGTVVVQAAAGTLQGTRRGMPLCGALCRPRHSALPASLPGAVWAGLCATLTSPLVLTAGSSHLAAGDVREGAILAGQACLPAAAGAVLSLLGPPRCTGGAGNGLGGAPPSEAREQGVAC